MWFCYVILLCDFIWMPLWNKSIIYAIYEHIKCTAGCFFAWFSWMPLWNKWIIYEHINYTVGFVLSLNEIIVMERTQIQGIWYHWICFYWFAKIGLIKCTAGVFCLILNEIIDIFPVERTQTDLSLDLPLLICKDWIGIVDKFEYGEQYVLLAYLCHYYSKCRCARSMDNI